MNFEELTPELKEKILGCKTPEDLLALSKAEDCELNDEELAAVAGGGTGWCNIYCGDNEEPYC